MVIETSKGTRELFLSENNLVVSGCHLIELRHILSESDNMIITLEPFIGGHVSFASSEELSDDQVETVKQVKALKPQKIREKEKKPKPIKKTRHEEESSDGSDEPDNTSDKDLVTPKWRTLVGDNSIRAKYNTTTDHKVKAS